MECDRKMDINTAGLDDLKMLEGVGPARARAILNHRKKLGYFLSLSELLEVPKLGQNFVDRHKKSLVCKQSSARKTPFAPHRELRSCSRAPLKRKLPLEEKQATMKVTRQSSVKNKLQSNQKQSLNGRRRGLVKSSNRTGQRTSKTINDIKLDLFNVYNNTNHHTDHPLDDVADEAATTQHNDHLVTSSSQTADKHNSGMSLRSKNLPTTSKHHLKHLKNTKTDTHTSSHTNNHTSAHTNNHSSAHTSSHTNNRTGGQTKNIQAYVVSSQSDDLIIGEADTSQTPTDHHHTPPHHHHHHGGSKAGVRNLPQKDLGVSQWLETFMSWGTGAKLQALDRLMGLCEAGQVRHVMQVIEPQFQRDFISLLPKELALYVLSFLDAKDLLAAAQTCSYWHTLAEDNLLWREKCQEEDITELLVYPGNTGRGRKVHRNEHHHHTPGVRGSTGSFWKSLYLRQKQIENNWKTVYRTPKYLKGHDDHVITCLEFSGSKIVSGSDDNTLKVWSALTGRCLRTLYGHTGGVWSSQMSGCLIISGSTDRTLRVWNAETGVCKHTLSGHTSTVRCMHLHNKRVVSGSRDATLRVWDVESGQCLHILIGHVAAVRCVQYDGVRVVSGGYDYMVKIWDPETETCLQTLSGHTNRVYSLQFDGSHIVSGSLDTSIRVWNVETGVCVQTLIGHQSLTSGMELKNNILVSGNADSTVKVWNIATGQCLQTLHGPNKHLSAVTCLQFNGNLIITSSDDGTVKLWDLRTGDFIRNLVALESGGSGGVVWRIRCSNTKLVCAVGSRNGTEDTKLLVIDFGIVDDEAVTNNNSQTTVASNNLNLSPILPLPIRYV